ncbi:hypothetical protein EPI10_011155 [Gossypium australe]|uniref:Uncharacterized protein n=1 Tax=Gossypium australe TaxID=47621 RepID=A0A5B6W729_9ROSI|nr:hypothetical protein EPI10_011155 [Gossypium australe]
MKIKEYVNKYTLANIGKSIEIDVQQNCIVTDASTTRGIGKGKIIITKRYILGRSVHLQEKYGDFDTLEWWKVNNLKLWIL